MRSTRGLYLCAVLAGAGLAGTAVAPTALHAQQSTTYSLARVVEIAGGPLGRFPDRLLARLKDGCLSFDVGAELRPLIAAGFKPATINEMRRMTRCQVVAQTPAAPRAAPRPPTPAPQPAAQPRPPAATPAAPSLPRLTVGQSSDGSLSSNSTMIDGYRMNEWTFTGRGGDRVAVLMQSEAFDPYVSVGRLAGGQFEELVSDDDSGGFPNARAVLRIPSNGEYLVRARSYAQEPEGAYTLSVESLPPAVLPQTGSITINSEVYGTLESTDALLEVGEQPHEHWLFTASGGELLDIHLSSDEFDPVLEIGQMIDGEFEQYGFDDDSGDGTDSLLGSWQVPSAGDYIIRVRPLLNDETGSYALWLGDAGTANVVGDPDPLLTDPAPLAGSVEELYGFLDATTASTDAEGRLYNDWPYFVMAGERWRFEVESAEFDTYIQVGYYDVNGQFVMVDYNDDFDGTDSRLDWTAPSTAEYIVRVHPYSSTTGGEYWLTSQKIPELQPMSPGMTGREDLAETDAVLPDGRYYDEWTFSAAAGQQFRIRMSSTAMDSYLIVGQYEDDFFLELVSDDDSGDGAGDAELTFTADLSGEYTIRTTSFGAEAIGAYTVQIFP